MTSRMIDFQIPQKVEVERETLTKTYGRFSAEPFERGFGSTIGNSLRRILLSSITGAAVTAIKIDGVLHEFSVVTGVKEDVVDIILNIKKLRLKLHSSKEKTIYLKRKGAGSVFAKHITHDADVEILSPDLHIAQLDKDGKIDMEMIVRNGRGYVPAERSKEEGMDINLIPIDAVFSPIRKINFSIENARVGHVTDYDKLIFEIWTDGTILPEDVLGVSAKILKNHLNLFINSDEDGQETEQDHCDSEEFNQNLLKNVNELELSVRAANCLKNARISTISDLVQRSESEMLLTKNFGRKSLNEIKDFLCGMGLSLGMTIDKNAHSEEIQKQEN